METTRFDIAEHLETREDIAVYLSDALETGDPGYIGHALGKVAKARNMSALARDTGLTRQALYKALDSEGNPEMGTVIKVLGVLGLKLAAVPA